MLYDPIPLDEFYPPLDYIGAYSLMRNFGFGPRPHTEEQQL